MSGWIVAVGVFAMYLSERWYAKQLRKLLERSLALHGRQEG